MNNTEIKYLSYKLSEKISQELDIKWINGELSEQTQTPTIPAEDKQTLIMEIYEDILINLLSVDSVADLDDIIDIHFATYTQKLVLNLMFDSVSAKDLRRRIEKLKPYATLTSQNSEEDDEDEDDYDDDYENYTQDTEEPHLIYNTSITDEKSLEETNQMLREHLEKYKNNKPNNKNDKS